MTSTVKEMLEYVLDGHHLREQQSASLLKALTDPSLAPAVAGATLAGLRAKGVVASELRGFASAMRELARKPNVDVDLQHRSESVMVYKRKGRRSQDDLLVILNMTPVERFDWPIEYTGKAFQKEIFNSDAKEFWGTGRIHNQFIVHQWVDKKAKRSRIIVNLPALSGIVLK